MSLSPPISNI